MQLHESIVAQENVGLLRHEMIKFRVYKNLSMECTLIQSTLLHSIRSISVSILVYTFLTEVLIALELKHITKDTV